MDVYSCTHRSLHSPKNGGERCLQEAQGENPLVAALPCALDPHRAARTLISFSPRGQPMQGASPFFLMAGPNVIQSQEHIFKMCREIKSVTDE